MTTGDAMVDFMALKEAVNGMFTKGTTIFFAGPDMKDAVRVFSGALSDAAMFVLVQPLPMPEGEPDDDARRRMILDEQCDGQVLLVFPHPFDAISSVIRAMYEGSLAYAAQHDLTDDEAQEWELTEIARIKSDHMQLRRHTRQLMKALAAGDSQTAYTAMTALKPLCGFTTATFSHGQQEKAARNAQNLAEPAPAEHLDTGVNHE